LNLTEKRVNRGLSLPVASREIGISRGTLQRAEAGEMPSPALAKKIADFYGVQVTDIWPLPDRSAA
jgi:transcriptional regulator with XRE-family HTH domain